MSAPDLTPREQAEVDRFGLLAPIISPDCRDGKCAACTRHAWDMAADAPAECQHHCHTNGEPNV